MIYSKGQKLTVPGEKKHQPLKVFQAVIESTYGAESDLIAALGRLEALPIRICLDEKHVILQWRHELPSFGAAIY